MCFICTLNPAFRECKQQCGGCGWNIDEQKRRKALLAKKGMTKGKDGLRRLIIKRKASEE